MLMNSEANRAKHFGNVCRTGILVAFTVALSASPVFGQAKPNKIRSFWVTGTSAVTVKADRALVVREIRTSSPRLEDALCEIERVSKVIAQEFEQRGLAGKFRFTANHYFAGGVPLGEPRTFAMRTSSKTYCFEVKKYVIVTFDESDVVAPGFDDTVTSAVDVLTNAGAQLAELPFSVGDTRFAEPVLFTLKDPQPIVLEAIRLAMDQARIMGEEVAKNSGRKLGPIIDARVNRPMTVELPRQRDLTVFDELNWKYFGSSKDAVTIPATFAVQYSTK
jgi:uncharacterized protein YggE